MNVRLSTGRMVTVRITDSSPGKFGTTTYDQHHGKLTSAEAREIAEAIIWSVEDRSIDGLLDEIERTTDEH